MFLWVVWVVVFVYDLLLWMKLLKFSIVGWFDSFGVVCCLIVSWFSGCLCVGY